MTFLDYKLELANLKRAYLDLMYLVDDFQKDKLLIEIRKIESKIYTMNSLYIEHLFDVIEFEFYVVESKL